MRRFYGWVGIVLVLLGQTPRVSLAAAGTSGGAILGFAVGARAIGMGEAYTAQSDDVSSLYWNPAGLAIMNHSQTSFMYNQSYQGLSFSNASVAVPFEYGGFGTSLSYLSYGAINGYDTAGNATSNVSAYSGVATLGAGWYGGPLSLGVNTKLIREYLADTGADAVAFDFGAIWTCQQPIWDATLRLAATVRNLGTGLTFINQTDPLPEEWRLGAALVQLLDSRLNLSVDIGKQRDLSQAAYAGAEYWIIPFIALRAGYAGTEQAGSGIRAGLGLRVRDISFDYAYAGFGDLGLSNRFELSMRFGPVVPRLNAEERALYRRAKLALAQGRFDEATLLFNSLVQLEPGYRPFLRRMDVALHGSMKQEQLRQEEAKRPRPVLHSNYDMDYDGGEDMAEIQKLLETDENATVAQNTTATKEAIKDVTPDRERNR